MSGRLRAAAAAIVGVPWVRLAGLLLILPLGGCHELGNPVTRSTPATPFPTEPPHTTVTHMTYAHSYEAVAWRRPPAHALDQNLPSARYIARVDVDHAPLGAVVGSVRLATTIAFADGHTQTVEWLAPASASHWSLDLALPSPPTRAMTRVALR